MDGFRTDLKLAELGNRGVDLLLGDSTNAERPGVAGPSGRWGGLPPPHPAARRPRANRLLRFVHRVQQAIDVASETGRKVTLIGRSLRKNVNIARNLGYLDVGDELLVKPDELDLLRPEETMILCTGSQGEPMSALTRMAYRDHPHVSIEDGDTVIISAKPVLGTSCASTTRSTASRSPGRRCCTRRSRRSTSPGTGTPRRSAPSWRCSAPGT